jgi:hypothetical protein
MSRTSDIVPGSGDAGITVTLTRDLTAQLCGRQLLRDTVLQVGRVYLECHFDHEPDVSTTIDADNVRLGRPEDRHEDTIVEGVRIARRAIREAGCPDAGTIDLFLGLVEEAVLVDAQAARATVEIEVSERPMDHWIDPLGNHRPMYEARIKGKPGYWGCGRSPHSAIGDLVYHHQEAFGVSVAECPQSRDRKTVAEDEEATRFNRVLAEGLVR